MVHPFLQDEVDILEVLSKRAFRIDRHPEKGKVCIDAAFTDRAVAGMALGELNGFGLEVTPYFWTLGTFHMPDIIECLYDKSKHFGAEYTTSLNNIVSVVRIAQREGLPEAKGEGIDLFLDSASAKGCASTNVCLHIEGNHGDCVCLKGFGGEVANFGGYAVEVPQDLLDVGSVATCAKKVMKVLEGERCPFEWYAPLYRLYKSMCLLLEVPLEGAVHTVRVKAAEKLLLG